MMRILLVDDDRDILDILRLELGDEDGFSVDTCATAPAALKTVRGSAYDVIVTDWRMPGMNGTEFVRTLRGQGCRSYIIIYSGLGMGKDIRAALDNGADYYVNRCGDPDTEFAELKKVIRTAAGPRSGP